MQRVCEVERRPHLPIRPPQFDHEAGNGRRPKDRERGLGLVEIGSAERKKFDLWAFALAGLALPALLHQRMHAAPVGECLHDRLSSPPRKRGSELPSSRFLQGIDFERF